MFFCSFSFLLHFLVCNNHSKKQWEHQHHTVQEQVLRNARLSGCIHGSRPTPTRVRLSHLHYAALELVCRSWVPLSSLAWFTVVDSRRWVTRASHTTTVHDPAQSLTSLHSTQINEAERCRASPLQTDLTSFWSKGVVCCIVIVHVHDSIIPNGLCTYLTKVLEAMILSVVTALDIHFPCSPPKKYLHEIRSRQAPTRANLQQPSPTVR